MYGCLYEWIGTGIYILCSFLDVLFWAHSLLQGNLESISRFLTGSHLDCHQYISIVFVEPKNIKTTI